MTLTCLNEVQLPKELQRRGGDRSADLGGRLNEVQLPKELQLRVHEQPHANGGASMKCSSRRNCNRPARIDGH